MPVNDMPVINGEISNLLTDDINWSNMATADIDFEAVQRWFNKTFEYTIEQGTDKYIKNNWTSFYGSIMEDEPEPGEQLVFDFPKFKRETTKYYPDGEVSPY